MWLLTVVACRSPGTTNPWLDSTGIHDETWGESCGPWRLVTDQPQSNDVRWAAERGITWQAAAGRRGPVEAECELAREIESGRLTSLSVRVYWREDLGATAGTALPTIERVRALLLTELEPAYRPWVLLAGLEPQRTVVDTPLVGHYHVDGGFDLADHRWNLSIFRMHDD